MRTKRSSRLISSQPEKHGILFDLLRRSSNEESLLVRAIASELSRAEYGDLLDIGAGDGSVTQHLMRFFRRVTAIDNLPSNIYFLKSLGIDAHQGTWESFKPVQSYDVILASHMLYYLSSSELHPQLSKMGSCLTASGSLFIVLNSQKGQHAEFTRRFYSALHQNLKDISLSNLIDTFTKQHYTVQINDFMANLVFENLAHFLAISRFLLNHDFTSNEANSLGITDYYSSLSYSKDQKRRTMNLDQNLLIIRKT